jgi:flagellar basal body P-ring formation protein FlgA
MLFAALRNVALIAAALLGIGVAPAWAEDVVTIPVPTVTIYPGQEIGAENLTDRTFYQSQVASGYVDSQDFLVGKVAKRTLLPDHPIAASAIGEDDLIKRGTAVQLVFQQPGLTITTYASPLQDGSPGDLIRVRNTDSGTIVVGVIQPDGTVRVGAQ